jgi:type II secretory pathway pseudopilin PulG
MHARPINPAAARRAFTLVEAALSTVIVAVVAVAGMNAGSIATKSRKSADQASVARELALNLLSEVSSLPYADPDPDATAALGPDKGDVMDSRLPRTADDCDDYNGFTLSPITDKTGNALTNDRWSMQVRVDWLDVADPNTRSNAETGLKRIRITVTRNAQNVLTLHTMRAKDMDAAR